MGVCGRSPQRGQGQSLWSEGQEANPPEVETLLASGRLMEAANLHSFLKFRNAKKLHLFVLSLIGHSTSQFMEH